MHPQREGYWGHVNPIGPRGVYDEAKRYAEALTMAYHRQQGVDTHIVRIFNTYGPRMRPHDGRAIPTFLRQALEQKPLTVFGNGSQTRSFCFVSDLVEGFLRLIDCAHHEPVNIGQPGRVHDPGAGRGCSSSSPAAPRRSSTRRCPRTTPPCASRTSAWRASCWAGSPPSSCERAWSSPCAGWARRCRFPADAAVRARGLAKSYGALRAVDGVDLRIELGECFGFLGPNGAGKTTTMRMLSCLAPRDRGELEVLGLDPDREPRRLKRMLGVVAQDTTLDLELKQYVV